ncbi:MAG: sigma-70 family RNA polymerase sigma factor [Verrucomicrobiae bacterium]|nr:sigma-70 family RNA polymerase sigma factor [Verrucomicrobiae bacterium]
MAKVEQDPWFVNEVYPHEPQLRAYLRSRFPTLDDPDDIVQETYTRLIKVHQASTISEPKALLFTIARNVVYDLYRRKKIVSFESLTQFSDSFVSSDEASVEDTVSLREEIHLLVRAVESLPQRCRQVMTLRMIYGLSQKEIAEELGISPHTVKVQLAKGVRRSAQYLAQYDDRSRKGGRTE